MPTEASTTSPRSIFDEYVQRASQSNASFRFLPDTQPIHTQDLLVDAEKHGERLAKTAGNASGIVAVLASTQEAQLRHVLACLAANLVPTVLTPPNRKLERSYYLETTRAVLANIAPILVATDLPDEVAECTAGSTRAFVVTDAQANGRFAEPTTDAWRQIPENTVFVQFSSGTTGIKKGVAVGPEQLKAQLQTYGEALMLTPQDHVVSWLPLYHDMGYITALHLPLWWGLDATMLDPIAWIGSPDTYLKAVDTYKGTLSWHPNFAYSYMAQRSKLEAGEADLSSLRLLVNCSEPVTAAAQQQFNDRFADLGLRNNVMTGCYAMAESTFALTHGVDTSREALDEIGPKQTEGIEIRKPYVSVGKPLPLVDIDVKAEPGNIGEIWVRAPFLVNGYLADDDATNAAFTAGWYNTGDLGYTRDGNLYVLGRRKDVLIVAGHNVFPEDVERAIADTDGIKQGRVACFEIFDEHTQTGRIIALAETDKTSEVNLTQIRQRLLTAFGASIDVSLVEQGWLIKSSAGKISRAKSKEKWLVQLERLSARRAN